MTVWLSCHIMTMFFCFRGSQAKKVGHHWFNVWVTEIKNRPLVILCMWFFQKIVEDTFLVHLPALLSLFSGGNNTNKRFPRGRREVRAGQWWRQASGSLLVPALQSGFLTVLIGSGSKATADRKMDKNLKEGQEKNHQEASMAVLTECSQSQHRSNNML